MRGEGIVGVFKRRECLLDRLRGSSEYRGCSSRRRSDWRRFGIARLGRIGLRCQPAIRLSPRIHPRTGRYGQRGRSSEALTSSDGRLQVGRSVGSRGRGRQGRIGGSGRCGGWSDGCRRSDGLRRLDRRVLRSPRSGCGKARSCASVNRVQGRPDEVGPPSFFASEGLPRCSLSFMACLLCSRQH